MIGLFAQLGKSRKDPENRMDTATFQSRLTALPVRAQYTLQQALAGLAAQAPMDKPDKPMLLKLAEHVAIRFALDSYERGELRVNAVKQLLDRMNAEIEALTHEIQDLMWKEVGIVRDGPGLKRAIKTLESICPKVAHPRTRRAYEARNLQLAGLLVARSALAREESRGAHYRTDFPNHDDVHFLKHSIVRGNTVKFE